MSEQPPAYQEQTTPETGAEGRRLQGEIVALARDLSERQERFTFPGMNSESYEKASATDKEYPGYTTPIDVLLARFQLEGMRVVLSPGDPESGNVYVLPMGSDDIGADSISPRQLEVVADMDALLVKLIEADKRRRAHNGK
jgi:hypothetical protein